MKIYCVRHGHAEPLPDASGDRPLTQEGVEELTKVANYLGRRGVNVSHVLHSDKLRARQTAEILAKKIAPHNLPEESRLLSPDQPIDDLVEKIANWHDDTLLVGHMPNISLLVSELITGDRGQDLVLYTPGTIVCLERNEMQGWIISWILRPSLVPDRYGRVHE
jgi:phosphohistidine phosphatase